MHCNAEGRRLIESFESCRLSAYQDGKGVWTIGYGHTGADVLDGLVWTQEQSDAAFEDDIHVTEAAITMALPDGIGPNEFSACVSLAFNIGIGNFRGSTLAALIRAGNISDAAREFPKWNHVNGVVSLGLTRRRAAEMTLFCKDDVEAIA